MRQLTKKTTGIQQFILEGVEKNIFNVNRNTQVKDPTCNPAQPQYPVPVFVP